MHSSTRTQHTCMACTWHVHGTCMAPRQAETRNNALAEGCMRANATELIWWDPKVVHAAMVTCGRLCPGLNSIIKGTNPTCVSTRRQYSTCE